MTDPLSELRAVARTVLDGPLTRSAASERSFVRLGGDSLRAMRLCALVEDSHGLELTVGDLLCDTPLDEVLASALSRPPRARPSAAGTPGTGPDPLRPSAAQRGTWMADQVVGSAPFSLVFVCFVDGPVSAARLRAAVDWTVARHEGLRTCFPLVAGEIVRRVLDTGPALQARTVAGAEGTFEHRVRSSAVRSAREPFTFDSVPPVRFELLTHDSGRAALVITAHHVLLDGAAVGVVISDIWRHYDRSTDQESAGQESADREPVAWMADHLDIDRARRDSGEVDAAAAFWRRHLDGVPTVLDLPADRARAPFPTRRGARLPFELDDADSAAITAQTGRLGVTPAAFLFGAYALTLARFTGLRRFLVGIPVAGTPARVHLVGVTVNLVPVLVDLDAATTVADLVRDVQASLARSVDRAVLPFEELVALTVGSGAVGRHPLVQVAFGMHDSLIPRRITTSTLDVRVEEVHAGGTQFDLELFVDRSSPRFGGSLEYATDLWRPAEAAAFTTALVSALREMALAEPDTPVADIRCVDAATRHELTRTDPTTGRHRGESIDGRLRAHAERTPDAVAVREGADELTYRELVRAASSLARSLHAAGVRAGDVVVVSCPRSIAETVAVIAVLWVGAAYMGVAADEPQPRVDQFLSIARPAAVVATEQYADGARFGSVPVVSPHLDEIDDADLVPPVAADPDRLAYVCFTSGSTGVPKGVRVVHRGVLRLVDGLGDYAPVGPGDAVLRFAALAFDASTLELWSALLCGATLDILPHRLPTPGELGQFIDDRAITFAWLTSGLFSLVSDHTLDRLGGMRHLLTGGDVVDPEHVRRVVERHRDLVVVNGYGPTENTVFTTVHPVSSADAVESPLPIGRPVPHTRVYVLDGDRRVLPPGAVGELYIAGDGLADGYLGMPPDRFESFSVDVDARLYGSGDLVRWDSRGTLRFLGRVDDQVKINGYRIELDEVRRAVVAHPKVGEALVTVVGGDGVDKRLLAGVVPSDPSLSAAELAEFVRARLPRYMVPGLWAMVAQWPLTRNGKVDRACLERTARSHVAEVS